MGRASLLLPPSLTPCRSSGRPELSAKNTDLWLPVNARVSLAQNTPVSGSFPTPAPSSFWHQRAENVTTDEVMPMEPWRNDLSNNLGCWSGPCLELS